MLGELFGYSVDAIVAFLIAWFIGSILAYRFIFIPIVLPFIQKTLRDVIIRIFTKPDKEEKEALFGMLDLVIEYFGSRQIATGNKIKVATDQVNEDGTPIYKEMDEVMFPIDLVGRRISDYAVAKLKGQAGGVKTQLNRAIQEGLAGEGMALSPTALKALSKGQLGPALTEALLPELMKRLNKGQGDTSSGGWK